MNHDSGYARAAARLDTLLWELYGDAGEALARLADLHAREFLAVAVEAATVEMATVEAATVVAAAVGVGPARISEPALPIPFDGATTGYVEALVRLLHEVGDARAERDPFTGRQELLQDVEEWLAAADRGVYVVTGAAGVGKSALLATQLARRMTPPDPAHLRADACLRAARKTLGECLADMLAQLLPAFSLAGATFAEFLTVAERARRSTVVVVDGLDEVQDPDTVVDQLIRPLAALPGMRIVVETREPTAYGLQPDRCALVTTGLHRELDVLETWTRHRVAVIPAGFSVGSTPDGPVVATGSDDGTVRVVTFRGSRTYRTGRVTAVTVGMFGDHVAMATSASSDGTIRIWDLATAEELFTLHSGDSDPPSVLRFCSDEDRPLLASGGDDGRVRVWDLTAGTPPATASTGSAVRSLAVDREGRLAVAGPAAFAKYELVRRPAAGYDLRHAPGSARGIGGVHPQLEGFSGRPSAPTSGARDPRVRRRPPSRDEAPPSAAGRR